MDGNGIVSLLRLRVRAIRAKVKSVSASFHKRVALFAGWDADGGCRSISAMLRRDETTALRMKRGCPGFAETMLAHERGWLYFPNMDAEISQNRLGGMHSK
jgi:hypothetical protein